jgi:superoxide dismutase, Fe-Mn family
LFWKNLAPHHDKGGTGGQLPQNYSLYEGIVKTFKTPEEFKKAFNTAALSIQGSGWCWLVSLHLIQVETGRF